MGWEVFAHIPSSPPNKLHHSITPLLHKPIIPIKNNPQALLIIYSINWLFSEIELCLHLYKKLNFLENAKFCYYGKMRWM